MYEVLNYKLINKPRSFTHPGLLLYIHEQIWNSVKVCNCANTDDRIWVKLHDINTSYNNTFICFCYMPPEGSTAMCNNNIDWSSLKLEVAGFSSEGNVILCGDLNARTGNQLDYIEGDGEIPLQFPFPYTIDQECPRVSFVSTQGKFLLNLCISSGMRILNGRHEGDSNGEFTCFIYYKWK